MSVLRYLKNPFLHVWNITLHALPKTFFSYLRCLFADFTSFPCLFMMPFPITVTIWIWLKHSLKHSPLIASRIL